MKSLADVFNLVGAMAPIVSFVMNFFLAWIAWSMRQLAKTEIDRIVGKATVRLDATDGRHEIEIVGHGTRLTKLEGMVKAMPQRVDFDALKDQVADVAQLVAKQSATLQAVAENSRSTQAGVDRLYQYMLEHNR